MINFLGRLRYTYMIRNRVLMLAVLPLLLPMLPSAAHAQSNWSLCMNDKSANQSVCSNGQTTCLFDKNVPVRCVPDVSSPLG
jgi:hypothetical protein